MVFNSLIFLFFFLPISILLYRGIKNSTGRNILLVILSFIFYSWSSPKGLILLILSIAWNFVVAIEMDQEEDEIKRKREFILGVVVNLGILGVFKYTNFVLNLFPFFNEQLEILLPVGLSFFTFSEITYLVDVYRHDSVATKNLLQYTLYVSFFGKISMGPIVSYHEMENQLSKRNVSKIEFSEGMVLFTKGFVKKTLLADPFSAMFSSLAMNQSVIGTWLYAMAYMLEIYFDFSGYSDMAIGIGKMFGFEFKANFEHPYIATSVQDFWRRWHISLSQWFRDYLYIPLGGSRVDTKTYIRNIMIIWFCTGLWHGANWTFIVWGLYYGAFTLLEKFYIKDFLKKHKTFSHFYSILVILVGWVFFFSPSIIDAFHVLGRMIGIHASSIMDANAIFVLLSNLVIVLLGILFSMDIFKKIQTIILNRWKRRGIQLMMFVYVLSFVLGVAFVIGSSYHSFLYFAF